MFRPDSVESFWSRLRGFVPAPVRQRLLLKVGVLIVVVMFVVASSASVLYVGTSAAIDESTEERFEGTTQMQASTLTEWNERMKDQTVAVSTSLQLDYGSEHASAFLTDRKDQLPEYVGEIHVVSTDDGEITASSSEESVGTTLDDTGATWASDGVEVPIGIPVVTDPYYDENVEGPAMAYIVHVQASTTEAVVVVVDLEERSTDLDRMEEGADTVVVDDDGIVVMSHRTDDIGEPYLGGEGTDSTAVGAGHDGETGYVETDVGGTTMAVGYAPVEETDWVVMTQMPASDATETSGLFLWSIGGMVLASFVGLGVIAAAIGRGTASDITRLASTARRLEGGDLSTTIESGREDELGDLYRSFDAMRESLAQRIEESERAHQEAEQARQHSEELTRHLETKAAGYSQVMRDVADGDLTRRMDAESRSETMTEIAAEFNEMIEQLESLTHEGKTFAEDVAGASEEVTASAEEVEASAQQIADSIQEISAGADRQDHELKEVSEKMDSLSTTVEEIAASADQVAQVAQKTAETGEEGREAAEYAVEEMDAVERNADRTVETMERLQEQMTAIEEVTEFITEVAEQTNILALNANIEAARAGEAGEGFAVVAEEVKRLAEDTREAAGDIEQRLEALREQTELTADEVRETSEAVAETAAIVQTAIHSLDEIAGYAEETNVGIQEISEATSAQAVSTNEVVSTVDEAAAIAEQTSQEATNVASATEEQTVSLSQMTENASSLAGEASRLSRTLDRFDTETKDGEVGSDAKVEGAVKTNDGD